MSGELKPDLAHAGLIRDLAHFASIVRIVQREKRRDRQMKRWKNRPRSKKLCKRLVEYEDTSEVIGMIELV